MILTNALVTVRCAACSMDFGIPEWLNHAKRSDQTSFYCPAGHSQYFPKGKTSEDLVRERLARTEMKVANLADDLRAERSSHAATKGKLTKTKNRIANGVCPCCNRTFVQLARHMKSQHPEYAPQNDEAPAPKGGQ